MTVNEMIQELERQRVLGNGEKKLVIWEPGGPGYSPFWRDPASIMYRPLRPEGQDAVEIV